jgi:hypothetical protein
VAIRPVRPITTDAADHASTRLMPLAIQAGL